MEILFGLGLVVIIIVFANWAETQSEVTRRFFDWLLLLFNLPVLLFGLVLALLPAGLQAGLDEVGLGGLDLRSFGVWLILMAIWGGLASLGGLRRRLFRGRGRFRPDSPVHATALVLSGYLVGNTLATLSQGGLEGLALTAQGASIWDVLGSQFLFLMVALLGVGLIVRRPPGELRRRLGLERPTGQQLLLAAGAIVLLVLAQFVAGAAWALLDPEQAQLLEDITETLLGDIDTVLEWLILAAATGLGEELLFRGALQPVFGLWTTSLLFAVAHVQYGITPVTLFVFLLAIVLGLIRRHTNTTVAVLVHGGYNFLLGMLALLATYLEPLIESVGVF